jgi:hypothetical protein
MAMVSSPTFEPRALEALGRDGHADGACRRRSAGYRCGLILVGMLASPARAPGAVPPPDPSAQSSPERDHARALLRDGVAAMNTGDYPTAVARFREAYALVPSAKILFNLGVAYGALDRYPEALESLERFLRDAPEASADTVRRAKAEIQKARAMVATVEVIVDRDRAEVTIDGRGYGRTPIEKPIVLGKGPHAVVARAGTQVTVRDFTAEAGTRQTLRLKLGLPPAPAPEGAAQPASSGSRIRDSVVARPATGEPRGETGTSLASQPWFWLAIGAALSAATVGGYLVLHRPSAPPCDPGVKCLP